MPAGWEALGRVLPGISSASGACLNPLVATAEPWLRGHMASALPESVFSYEDQRSIGVGPFLITLSYLDYIGKDSISR